MIKCAHGLLQLLSHFVQAFCDRADLGKPNDRCPRKWLAFPVFPQARCTAIASALVQGVDFTADNQAGLPLYRHQICRPSVSPSAPQKTEL